MGRTVVLCLFFPFYLMAFKPLSETYTIPFGAKDAPIQVVEYFSLSCPECLSSINNDFPEFSRIWIETGKVHWVFHPDPGDLLTFQLMVCLEKLLPKEKPSFFLQVAKGCAVSAKRTSHQMFAALEKMGRGKKETMRSLSFLEASRAAREAIAYLKQEDAPTKTPSVWIDKRRLDGVPTLAKVNKALKEKSKC